MMRYYSDDPGADFDRWERDREWLHAQLLEEGLLEEEEKNDRYWAEWFDAGCPD